MNVTKFYRCHDCLKFYASIDDAQCCCEPELRYQCGECGHYHYSENDAVICCDKNEPENLKEQLTLG
jgi:hypothetical protein